MEEINLCILSLPTVVQPKTRSNPYIEIQPLYTFEIRAELACIFLIVVPACGVRQGDTLAHAVLMFDRFKTYLLIGIFYLKRTAVNLCVLRRFENRIHLCSN